MKQITAAMILALLSCSIALTDPATSPRPASSFNVVLRLEIPSPQNSGNLAVTFSVGSGAASAAPKNSRDGSSLNQYLESLHDAAMDALFKQLHMA